jgi:hypothetical protein
MRMTSPRLATGTRANYLWLAMRALPLGRMGATLGAGWGRTARASGNCASGVRTSVRTVARNASNSQSSESRFTVLPVRRMNRCDRDSVRASHRCDCYLRSGARRPRQRQRRRMVSPKVTRGPDWTATRRRRCWGGQRPHLATRGMEPLASPPLSKSLGPGPGGLATGLDTWIGPPDRISFGSWAKACTSSSIGSSALYSVQGDAHDPGTASWSQEWSSAQVYFTPHCMGLLRPGSFPSAAAPCLPAQRAICPLLLSQDGTRR